MPVMQEFSIDPFNYERINGTVVVESWIRTEDIKMTGEKKPTANIEQRRNRVIRGNSKIEVLSLKVSGLMVCPSIGIPIRELEVLKRIVQSGTDSHSSDDRPLNITFPTGPPTILPPS